MKKMLCAIAMCVALVSGAFAQEAETSSKKGGFDYHNIKIEAAVPLVLLGIGFDVRGSYQFDINENWWWNVGLDTHFSSNIICGNNISILAFGSIGRKTIYLTYGLGLGINTEYSEVGFVPLDLRFGWQPGFKNKDSGLSFKLEAGLFGAWSWKENTPDGEKLGFETAPGINLGVAYKL